jgi:hypothetical protein
MCDWNLCNRYPLNFDLNLVKDGDFVFLNLDNYWQFPNFWNRKDIKINLITHNSDLTFTDEINNLLSPFCHNIYSINSISSNNKIPLGFSDRLVPVISSILKENVNKNNLIYLNFKIQHAIERKECFDFFMSKNWVYVEFDVPENQFYEQIKMSKYTLCPVGAGLDTHRFYESIYFNTIPIVKRNRLSDFHSKFPCIIVDNWSEINEEYLINNYESNLNKLLDWKKNNDWLSPKFWIK